MSMVSDVTTYVKEYDPEVGAALEQELGRQRRNLELIASENIVTPQVMMAMGTVPTNKYAEGYPGKRYYGGCEYVDVIENLAIERAKKLFGSEHVCVQPHSGASANMAVYQAFLKPGDTVMGLNLDHGGHLTHGSPVNMSGILYRFVPYSINDEGFLDYDEILRIAKECQPKMIVAGASAYPRAIRFDLFAEIAKEVGAILFVDMAHIAGLVAAGLHQSPVPYADVVTTTTHKTLRGPRGGMILCKEEHAKAINKAVFPGTQGGPLEHVIAAKAVAFGEALDPSYKEYQKQVQKNAKAMAEAFTKRGYKIVSEGTDNHLMLVDLRTKFPELTGKLAEKCLVAADITTNKNMVPFDSRSPFQTSGLRFGTPAITTRGLKEDKMEEIVALIDRVLSDPENEANIAAVRKEVNAMMANYPLFAW